MPSKRNNKYFFHAWDSVSLWVEGCPSSTAMSEAMAQFLFKHIICWYGCPDEFVMDGGLENQGLVNVLVAKYHIKKIWLSAYHALSNGGIESQLHLQENDFQTYWGIFTWMALTLGCCPICGQNNSQKNYRHVHILNPLWTRSSTPHWTGSSNLGHPIMGIDKHYDRSPCTLSSPNWKMGLRYGRSYSTSTTNATE